MRPYGNQILFRPFESEAITDGGLIIPDSVKAISNKGEITMVGEGTHERPMKLKPGMIGYRVKSWGQEIIINGVSHYLMQDAAIIALES